VVLRTEDGALRHKNLEHFDLNILLENLEEWERYLKADPQIAYGIRSLDENEPKANSSKAKLRGPRP
jgi:hypothetical protein